jgi:predicted amidohydrolase
MRNTTKYRRKGLSGIFTTAFLSVLILTSFKNTVSETNSIINYNKNSVPGYANEEGYIDQPASVLRIALAQLKRCVYITEGVRKIDSVLSVCKNKSVDIVCFPETYIPGLRGGGEDSLLPPPDQPAMEKALREIQLSCNKYKVAAIVGMEWESRLGLENRAYVISENGDIVGYQTKNQITPGGEEKHYVPENVRRMFSIKGVPFGIVICHEGWRFPETVRWAAVRGAKIVFQPQVTGSNGRGKYIERPWGQSYYEMAMVLRSKENSIFFASVNECMKRQNSATSLIDPEGNLIDHLPCGKEAIMIKDIDIKKATGFYANRYRPERYQEEK